MFPVTRLDRLARSTRDLFNTLAAIAGKRPDSVPWAKLGGHDHLARTFDADPSAASRSSSVTLYAHELRKPRTRQGARRQDRAEPKLTPHQQREAMKRRDNGEPVRDIARSFNVHHATISRLTT